MKKVIARVKLNPGQGGYFDPITRIHLTHGDPERDVYAGMNTEGLKQAVRNKRITLVSGSLGEFVPPFKLVRQADGKVVLVANNQKKNVQPDVAVKKDDITKAVVEQKKEVKQPVEDKKAKPVITEQKAQPAVETTPVVETKKVNDDIPQHMTAAEMAYVLGVSNEDTTADLEEQKSSSPFKKDKKNKGSKKDPKDSKTE